MLRRVGQLEQAARGLVDAGVGRLRGQHHGHQQRIGVDVFQLALGLGVGGREAAENLRDARRDPRPCGARLRTRAWAVGPGRTALGGMGLRAGSWPFGRIAVMDEKPDQTQAEPDGFRAVLTPYRSLGRRPVS